ncbi:uncharacterized protein LOC133896278 [Phragmites australis]|uniref:uncharacterized protein LOC133896278 n=1 Tax=Phragmites australis TaxID=29695 RepID=UPI002D79917C|nr:uncharacterized protein LOC133896278 [Phragmites australis]
MKSISKAADLLRKAAAALRGKAGVLRARLLFLASLRRRTAIVAGISRHIRALAPGQQGQEKAVHCRGMDVAPEEHADADDDNHHVFGLPNWTLTLHSLFDEEEIHGGGADENRYGDVYSVEGIDDEDEQSVIDVIRSRREGDGQEFRIEDEIDQAADMFITRVRRRMSAQPGLLASGGLH